MYCLTTICSAVKRIAGLVLLVHLISPAAWAENWQTAAAAEYKLLWKKLTYTELQVQPSAPAPAGGDILDPGYAKKIVIEYGLGVSAERFRDMTLEALEDAFSEQELAPHREDIDTFCSWFRKVEKGDHYSLAWQPGQTLVLNLNGEDLGGIDNAEAARIILSVWLGRAAVSESQRDEMLQQWQEFLGRNLAER